MVKPNPVGVGADNSANPALSEAESAAKRLDRGERVSADSFNRAKDAFLDTLRAGSPNAQARARQGLTTLFEKTPDNVDRAGVLGELLTQGPQAGKALDRIAESACELLREVVKPHEWADLTGRLLGRPLPEILEKVAGWLGREAQEHEPGGSRPPAAPRQPQDALPPTGRPSIGTKEETARGTGPDPDGRSPEEILNDRTKPEEVRCKAAEQMGASAIPLLEKLLKDDKQREFATATLIRLGSQKGLEREVYRAGERLEGDPKLRPLGELIRDSVRSQRGDGTTRPDLARNAGLSDIWLGRALERCDVPSILMAAAGRETLVIPLVLRKLVQLRTSRLS